MRFELTARVNESLVFKTSSLNRSDISPKLGLSYPTFLLYYKKLDLSRVFRKFFYFSEKAFMLLPSLLIRMFPLRSVLKISPHVFSNLSKTVLDGWPKLLFSPTEITAISGLKAFKKFSELEADDPW